MASYNMFILMGNLCADPELKVFGETTVCRFRVAANRKWGDKEETLFIDCTAFGRTAELINEKHRKGQPIHIDGRLVTDEWDDRDTGKRRSKIVMLVNSMQFLPGAPETASRGTSNAGQRTTNQRPAASSPPKRSAGGQEEINFDDIPFVLVPFLLSVLGASSFLA